MEATGCTKRVFRVPIGGREFEFLHSESAMLDAVPSADAQSLFVTTIMTPAAFLRFQSTFGQFRKVKQKK